MKISAEKYAQTLHDLTAGKDKNKNEIKKIIADFLKVLALNNDLAKADAIVAEMEKVDDEKNGIVKASIASANALSGETVNTISEFVKNKTGAEKIKISQEIKKDLIGGAVLRYGDKIVDFSLKSKLKELKNILSK